MEFEEDGEGGSKICDNPKIISKFKWKILSSDLPKPTLKKMTNLNFVRRKIRYNILQKQISKILIFIWMKNLF